MSLRCGKIIKSALICILAFVPLGLYVWQFHNSTLSSNPNDWASFGSYIGGVYSIIVALLVVYLARELSKIDEVAGKRKKAVEVLYQQIIKVNSEKVDDRSVHRIYKLLEENKLYVTDALFNEVKNLADYYLEVKGGGKVDYGRENRVKEHLRTIYNA